MADYRQNIASWQSFFVRIFFWLVWLVTYRKQHNALWQRKQLENTAVLLPRRKHTKFVKEKCHGLEGEWMIPDHANENRVLYYLHGGAFAMCSLHTHRRLISNIAHSIGIKAYAMEYALCPEVVFPVALNQAVDGYKWLLAKGYEPDNIIIAGDSAGGGLSITTMLKLRELCIALPSMAVLLSPWTDLEGTGNSNTEANQHNPINNYALKYYGQLYTGTADIRNPFISPIYADLSGFPPILIQVSDTELIHDDGLRLAEKARMANVDVTVQTWHNQVHVWQAFDTILPEAREAINKIGEWARV